MSAINYEKQKLGFVVGVGPYAIKSEDVTSLYFIEDILSLSIVGRLRFNDKLGIVERREAFDSGDPIIIKYGAFLKAENGQPYKWDENNSAQLTFFIQSVTAIETNRQDGTKGYDIVFADSSYFLLNNLCYSYSWANPSKYGEPPVTITDIVSSMIKSWANLPYDTNYEESEVYLPCYYSPYWTIRQNIQYLTPRNRSVPPTNVSGYCAFTNIVNRKFKFNFITLEKMLSEPPSGPIINFYALDATPMKVIDFQMLSYDNMGQWYLNGSTYYGYDFTRGKLPFKCVFDYNQAISKTTILGNWTLFGGYKSNSSAQDLTTDSGMPVIWTLETDEGIIENIWYDDWIKRYCQQQMMEVVVLGDPNISSGTLAQVEMPDKFPENFKGQSLIEVNPLNEGFKWDPLLEKLHKKWSGYALIKSITHYFMPEPPGYIQKIVLMKNGYEYVENPNKMPSIKKKVMSEDGKR